MTADRLDLDALEALLDRANGAEETTVEVEYADLEGLLELAVDLANEIARRRAERDAAQAALARVRTWAEARLLPERRSAMEQAQHAFAQHVLNVATEGQEAGD